MPKTPLQRRIAPSVTVTLTYPEGPVNFELAFNNLAIATIEEATGLNLLANAYSIFQKVDKHRLGIMFWAGLLQDRPELESKDGLRIVRSYLDTPENELKAFEGVWEAYLVYLPKELRENLKLARERWETEDKENPAKPATVAAPPAEQEKVPTG